MTDEQKESIAYAAEWLARSEDIGNQKHAERLRALLATPAPLSDEPVAEVIKWRTFTGRTAWDFKVFDKTLEHGAKLYAAPLATPSDKQEANESAYQRGYLDGMAKGKRDAERDALESRVPEQDRIDAERMNALCDEIDRNRRGVRYDGMAIWDAMCDAIGEDCDSKMFRDAIDAAIAKRASK